MPKNKGMLGFLASFECALRYCQYSWPYLKRFDFLHLVCVLNCCIRFILTKWLWNDFPYKERLLRLHLYTLKYRRLRGDMIEVFKLVNNVYDNRVAPSLSYNTSVTWGNKFKLQNQSFNHNFRKKFLFCKNSKYMKQFTKLCSWCAVYWCI